MIDSVLHHPRLMQRTRGSSCVSPFEQRGTALFGTGCKIITVSLSTPIYPCLLAAATCIRTELDRTAKISYFYFLLQKN